MANHRLLWIIFSLLILLTVNEVDGQKKYQFFQISGRVKMDKGEPSGASVEVMNLETKKIEKSITVSSLGKFDLQLNYQTEYKLSVSKAGHYSKDILISTLIPQNVWEKDSIFPPFIMVVTLFKKVNDAPLSFIGKTIGKISYSPNKTLDNFDSEIYIDDKDIRAEIDIASKSSGDSEFNRKLAAALEFEKNNDLKSAYLAYTEASKLNPNDKFVKEKLKDLASDLKDYLNELKLKAEFDRLISSGDANVTNKKYADAIINYKGALNLKPEDVAAKEKLATAEGLLARVNADKTKLEEEFSRLVAKGDDNVSKQLYPEAIGNYNGALKIKPSDPGVVSKLTAIEKLLARFNADKARLEAEFNRLLASGDKDVKDQKYADAIENYKGALNLKPEDAAAKEKLATAEGLLARVNADKAKLEEEFSRLVAMGDNYVSKQLYPEAIGNYNGALKIKPSDPGVVSKLAVAEKLLARFNADKAKLEAEFNRLLASGDKNVKDQKYADAIENYKGALNLKPEDAAAKEKLATAEGLLARVNADKAKLEEEFSRLVAMGDNYVSKQLYPEAIGNYNGALKIKPSDPGVVSKLAVAEKLLARFNADKAKLEAEFNRLLASGDKNVKDQKYADAIENYKGALNLKPEDAAAKEKLATAEGLLARVNADKAKLEEEFSRLVTMGDDNVKNEKYNESLNNYKGALQIKSSNEIVITKIAEVQKLIQQKEARELAEAERNRLYRTTIDKADKLYNTKIFAEAKTQYLEAINIDKSAIYPKRRISEIDSIMNKEAAAIALMREQEVKRRQSFNDWIKVGDDKFMQKNWNESLTAFVKAFEILPDNAYAKGKISEVRGIMAKEEKDMKDYQEAILRGADTFNKKQYNESLSDYREAGRIKPNELLPKQKIQEIQSILEELKQKELTAQKQVESNQLVVNENSYKENISRGDENFQKSQWTVSRFYYTSALKFKPDDRYAISQVEACDKMTSGNITAEKMKEYKTLISKGDEENKLKNYSSARFYYHSSLEILPWESYPQNKLKEIDQIFIEKLSQADQLLFKENVQKADEAFLKKEYSSARFYYSRANEINPQENVSAKLKQIEETVSGAAAKRIDAEYEDCIKKADEGIRQKNPSIARFYYQKAIVLKPNETYSVEQLKKLQVEN